MRREHGLNVTIKNKKQKEIISGEHHGPISFSRGFSRAEGVAEKLDLAIIKVKQSGSFFSYLDLFPLPSLLVPL